eukprot:gb/GFBE01014255.1/.p1 GENE.gb/GFBE01014255.1/~~gb/GFBE01014255.1/.p1  ORF type:complete len:239 (+),score=61.49 gb/GFBE01014255.1/:1-717(+)
MPFFKEMKVILAVAACLAQAHRVLEQENLAPSTGKEQGYQLMSASNHPYEASNPVVEGAGVPSEPAGEEDKEASEGGSEGALLQETGGSLGVPSEPAGEEKQQASEGALLQETDGSLGESSEYCEVLKDKRSQRKCRLDNGQTVRIKLSKPLTVGKSESFEYLGIEEVSLATNGGVTEALWTYTYTVKNTRPITMYLTDGTGDIYTLCMPTAREHYVNFNSVKPELVKFGVKKFPIVG